MSLITKFITAVTEPQFMLARDLMALAVADGEVTEEEQEAISNICHIEGIDEEHLINNLQRNTEHFPLYVPQTRKEKEEYLRDLILLIGSDEYCSPQEVYLFQIVASKMGLNQMDIVGLFMTTATHAYFKGDVGSKVLASFLKNYIDPIGRTEQQNMEGLRKMYETVANSIESSNDGQAYKALLHESLSKATQALLENQILHNGFQRIGIDFANLLNSIESQISFAKLREFSK
jgi:hypothetical protein